MTNPISKAIVKAAVAMGYGKKSDYKGSSVADVLEKFASIAKDKGSSGGGVMVVNGEFGVAGVGHWTSDYTYDQLLAGFRSGRTVMISIPNQVDIAAQYINYQEQFVALAIMSVQGFVQCVLSQDGTFTITPYNAQ